MCFEAEFKEGQRGRGSENSGKTRSLLLREVCGHHMALIAASTLRSITAQNIIEVITKYPNKPTALSPWVD